MEHYFTLTATWSGGLNGNGHIRSGNLNTDISGPKELQGPGIGTNPEELLLGAAGTCYLITLAAVLERRKLELRKLELSSEGFLLAEKGLRFTRIVHRPRIVLGAGTTEEQKTTAREACDRAEKACVISNAIRGNVEVKVEPQIEVG